MSDDAEATPESAVPKSSRSATNQDAWSQRTGAHGDPFSFPDPAMDSPFREEHIRHLGCPTCKAAALERKAKALRNRALCFALPSCILVAMGLILLALTLLHDPTGFRTGLDHDGNGAILPLLIGGVALAIPAFSLHRRRRKLWSHWH